MESKRQTRVRSLASQGRDASGSRSRSSDPTYSPPTHYDRGAYGRAYVPTSATPIPDYAARIMFEREVERLSVERLLVEGCMRVEPNGRPYLDPAPSTVGAGEVRVTERSKVRPNRGDDLDSLLDESEVERRSQGDYDRRTLPTWLVAVLYDLDRETRERVLDLLPSERVEGAEVEVERRSRSRVEVGADLGAAYLDRLAAFGADLSLIDA